MHKVGIIGAGLISYSHANAIKEVDNAELVAVAEIIEPQAKKFAAEFGCKYYLDAEEMLKYANIDMVIICLPTFLHERYVALAAKYKKNVLCEKPVEMTSTATENMLETVKNSGIIFMVAQVVRFWSGYTDIKEMYDAGEIGEAYMAFASRCSTLPNWGGGWHIDPNGGAGAIQGMHVHDVDFLAHLFGPVDYVFCHANKDHTGCWNHVMSSIAYKSGEKAVAEASFTMAPTYPFTMFFKVAGTKATIEFYYKAGINIGARDASKTKISIFRHGKDPIVRIPEKYDAYARQLRYYLSCVDAGKQPSFVPHQENMEVIRTIEAIRRSADTKEIIKL